MMNEPTHRLADDPLQDARIPPNIVAGVLDIVEQRGTNTEPLLVGTGLTRGQIDLPGTRLSFRQATTILRRALHTLPAGPVGMRMGGRDVLLSWGLVGFAIRSSRSGAEAIAIGTSLHQAAGSLLNCEINYGTDEFELRLLERSPDAELLPFLSEEACASIVALVRAAFGGQITPKRIEFSYPAPAYADVYRRFFQCPIQFGAQHVRIWFDTELLDRPIPTANPAQLAIAVEAARQLADAEGHRPDTVAAVVGVLRENLRHPVTMAQIADRLAISDRTLHRRLTDAGLKFGEIRDRVRMHRATVLLRESNIPVAVVATEVGFSDSRQFRRAYQRWTGKTPSAERASAGR
ncbi:AraC family transcriptional regulator ligand-binding domain-containing protein [Nocardia sp. CA-107356]|uniref:AraC family transcriptional regulator ligand-binding domain-containing protein n=1 Tax=Nocardia sp. CA-107356 TaxID=3239972 RepID=UPI003D89D627